MPFQNQIGLFAKLRFLRNRNSQFRNYRNFRNPFYNSGLDTWVEFLLPGLEVFQDIPRANNILDQCFQQKIKYFSLE